MRRVSQLWWRLPQSRRAWVVDILFGALVVGLVLVLLLLSGCAPADMAEAPPVEPEVQLPMAERIGWVELEWKLGMSRNIYRFYDKEKAVLCYMTYYGEAVSISCLEYDARQR